VEEPTVNVTVGTTVNTLDEEVQETL